jgi:glycosyltransferase family protein
MLAVFFPLIRKIYPFPRVASIDETLDELLQGNKSICRYGDGEFIYMLDEKELPFQHFNAELSRRLKEVIRSNDPSILIALPIGFHNLQQLTPEGRLFWQSRIVWLYPRLRHLLLPAKQYFNAHMTRIYHDLIDKSASERYIRKIMQLWAGRDVVVIEGEKSRLGLGNDLFAAASSVRRIVAPAHHAFVQFDPICAYVEANVDKQVLLLIALGPTATVMAYSLAKVGYQAIDIGNVDIEYEWYLRGSTDKIRIPYKYTGEAEGGRQVEHTSDEVYFKQIMANFGVASQVGALDYGPEIAWLIYGSDPTKRQQMNDWASALGIRHASIVNNLASSCAVDEIPGTNVDFEFSAYEQLLDSFQGPGPFVLVNDTLFRNHGQFLWQKLVARALADPGSYPFIWGDWREENIVFPEKPATYLASWIFVIPDRASLEVFKASLTHILHGDLPVASEAYTKYVINWLKSDKWFSGWHGPGDEKTLMRKQRTVRLEHALSIELKKRGMIYRSLGHFGKPLYAWIRIYDRLRTRWMALFDPIST